jgi:hypothetical protein
VYRIFAHMDFFNNFRIDVATFRSWICQVHVEYFENPFHVRD